MIKKLTQEQTDKIPTHNKKWIEAGLHPKQFTEEDAQSIVDGIYDHILKKKRVPIVICPSPYYAWYGIEVYKYITKKNFAVRSAVGSAVDSAVRSAVRSAVGSAVGSAVRSAVGSAVGSFAVGSAVDSAVRSAVGSSSFIWPWFDGHYMADYFAFYDFMFDVVGVKNPVKEAYSALKETCKLDVIYPLNDICIVSQNPTMIYLNQSGSPHCENGPAIMYPKDNYYFLNGVSVKKDIVETPAEKIDPHIILTETNAEVRREIVRKVGIERVCQKLGAKTIDSGLDYVNNRCELLQLEVGEEKHRYIKLINPSVEGIYHIEGVPNECNTVEEALKSRKPEGLRNIPIDDINGSEWYEQGDVCIWPKGAVSVKSKPITLT